MTILELLAGVVGAAALVLFARRYAREELSVYAAGLVVASLVYVVFALLRGAPGDLGIEAVGLMAFSLVAMAGRRRFPLLLGAGWLLHVGWDVLLHPAGGYAPGWYPVACIGFDLLIASYLVARCVGGRGATVSTG